MQTQNLIGAMGHSSKVADGYGRRVAGKQCVRRAQLVKFFKDLLFKFKLLEDRFDCQIDVFGRTQICDRGDTIFSINLPTDHSMVLMALSRASRETSLSNT
jgi:hypothetical protein